MNSDVPPVNVLTVDDMCQLGIQRLREGSFYFTAFRSSTPFTEYHRHSLIISASSWQTVEPNHNAHFLETVARLLHRLTSRQF